MAGKLVALSGWRGSGKDTVGDFLCREYGFQKISFAASLKDLVSELYDVPRHYMDDREFKEAPLSKYPVINTDAFTGTMQDLLKSELSSGFWTPRALCILEGSTKRSVYSNYWVSRAVRNMSPAFDYVISDMRYKSEADTLTMLMGSNFQLSKWRIERLDTVDTLDASERDLDDYNGFTHRIDNRSTTNDLFERVDFIIRSNVK